MIFRIHHETKGGHVHMKLFAGKHDGALGKCGDLCMRVDEFARFRASATFVQFREQAAIGQQIYDSELERRAYVGLTPRQVAADWFSLPPGNRTKERLLAMLTGEDEIARLYSIIRDRNRMIVGPACPHDKKWGECSQPECAI